VFHEGYCGRTSNEPHVFALKDSDDFSSGVFSSCSTADDQSFNVDWSVSTDQTPSCYFEGKIHQYSAFLGAYVMLVCIDLCVCRSWRGYMGGRHKWRKFKDQREATSENRAHCCGNQRTGEIFVKCMYLRFHHKLSFVVFIMFL